MASVAILIVGSLIWEEKPHRNEWRRRRLNVASCAPVRAPIRYGRKSASRDNTYTMVFSNELVPDRVGWGLAVPCRCEVNTPRQLFEEAEALWVAEQPEEVAPEGLAAGWGAVGLLCNPSTASLEEMQRRWADRVAEEGAIYRNFPCAVNEVPAVRADGLLTIPWPTTERGAPLEVDLLLATATKPNPFADRCYAAVDKIARAWTNQPGRREYFDNNRQYGIRTAFDDQILEALNAVSNG